MDETNVMTNLDSIAVPEMVPTGEATAILPVPEGRMSPITVIGTERIRAGFDAMALKQAINSRMAPGVS